MTRAAQGSGEAAGVQIWVNAGTFFAGGAGSHKLPVVRVHGKPPELPLQDLQ